MINLFKLCAILGLIAIITGISLTKIKERKRQYVLLIIGGILLEIYSIYIKDTIFIILQAVFVIFAVYDLIKLIKKQQLNNNKKKK